MYIVYIRESCVFCMCTFKEAINFVEVMVDVQKEVEGLEKF